MAAHALRWHCHPRFCRHRPGLHWHWRCPLRDLTEHPSVGGMAGTKHKDQAVSCSELGPNVAIKIRRGKMVDKMFAALQRMRRQQILKQSRFSMLRWKRGPLQ